jgi:hypothetical protein
VKKTGIFIILLVLCINNISLGQAYKLPVLINHFIEHHERDNRVTFLDFLSMHYWGKDINDNDQDKDMQLPFKDFSNNPVQIAFCPLSKIITLKTVSHSYDRVFRVRSENLLPDPILSCLLRPPIA